MYGLVNKAVEKFVLENYDEKTWLQIKQEANVEDEAFISMQAYSDDVTYNLVGAASKILSIEANDILELFGKYWIKFSMLEGYSHLIQLAGNSFPQFVKNLDNMHSHIAQAYTKLQPPSFQCHEIDEETIEVIYISHRPGLMMFVKGLFLGLGEHFKLEIKIEYIGAIEEGQHKFIVNYH